MNEPKGLMASDAQKLTKRGPQLQQFMQALGPSKTDVPLEQRLAAMSDTERATLLTTSKMGLDKNFFSLDGRGAITWNSSAWGQ